MMPILLHSLFALRASDRRVAFCFYLDGYDRGSADILRAAAARMPDTVHVRIGERHPEPNAGRARHAAMALGLEFLGGGEGLLFSTDADSQPAPDWLAAGTAALTVADAVAGKIVRLDGDGDRRQTRIERYYDRLYAFRRRLDPVPWEDADTHHFGGGANIAIRSGVYRALGGFRPLPTSEDATLLDDAGRAGFRVRRDATMIVATSSRRDGRVINGLATALRSLDDGDVQWVAHPESVAWQARAQALARRTFDIVDEPEARRTLGGVIGLCDSHIQGVARDCPNGEAFAMRIVPAAPMSGRLVTIDHAEAALRTLEVHPREVAA